MTLIDNINRIHKSTLPSPSKTPSASSKHRDVKTSGHQDRSTSPTSHQRKAGPPTQPPNLKSSTAILALLITLLSALGMQSLFTRLTRPFTTTASMAFAPTESSTGASASTAYPPGSQRATVAAGCFWGVEHLYRHSFAKDALLDARVGYIGGDSASPSYRAVCSGRTGHAEALQVIFDPAKVSYAALLEFFYKMHDPTTMNRQGPDTGSQYRSGIFYHDEEQEKIARDVTRRVGEQWWKSGKVVTEVLPAGQWWDAEAYHQLYLDKNPGGYECPSHFLRKFPPLQ